MSYFCGKQQRCSIYSTRKPSSKTDSMIWLESLFIRPLTKHGKPQFDSLNRIHSESTSSCLCYHILSAGGGKYSLLQLYVILVNIYFHQVSQCSPIPQLPFHLLVEAAPAEGTCRKGRLDLFRRHGVFFRERISANLKRCLFYEGFFVEMLLTVVSFMIL